MRTVSRPPWSSDPIGSEPKAGPDSPESYVERLNEGLPIAAGVAVVAGFVLIGAGAATMLVGLLAHTVTGWGDPNSPWGMARLGCWVIGPVAAAVGTLYLIAWCLDRRVARKARESAALGVYDPEHDGGPR